MTYLLDTNAFSALMRKRPTVEARLAAVKQDATIAISATVRGEVLYGIRKLPSGRRREELEAQAAALFEAIPCEPVPVTASDHYAAVKVARERAGLTLDENDLWIAASALALGAVLVTRDTDFARIDGLPVENWDS
jgi:tRNA(fMet)-specific endonuclease VapC